MRIFRGPKIKVYFPVNYLSLNELIGYVDMIDFGDIWPGHLVRARLSKQ